MKTAATMAGALMVQTKRISRIVRIAACVAISLAVVALEAPAGAM
jgi:hypothetical protein